MMLSTSKDSLKTRRTLKINDQEFDYFSLKVAEEAGLKNIAKLPFSLKIILENLLRFEDDHTVTFADIQALATWLENKTSQQEIAYRPARVLMQDFTGVPGIVDLAAMRAAMQAMGGDTQKINPLTPVDLVIDHSVQVDYFGTQAAFTQNVSLEMERNHERYAFLRWGQQAFANFRVVPPGTGICHQVNLEYLAKAIWHSEINGRQVAYPDTLVGTDSHTTMINGLGVLGWGVGGIEAEAVMLGQPISMSIPEVIGFKLTGKLAEGITATDLVLTITQMLRARKVVDKFVEFYGPGLNELTLPDRATIANMAPEYGATCGFFPIDAETVRYLKLTGREAKTINLVEAYCKAQGMWRDQHTPDPIFSDTLELDLSTVQPSLAGPKRPQDRVLLNELATVFDQALNQAGKGQEKDKIVAAKNTDFNLRHGDVVIAAITSCTNTSNPHVLMAAGLLAKKALEKGLQRKPWVKSSLAPGSKVVTDYLAKTGLQDSLDQLGFELVGYGCTTCIGNSGPLPEAVANAVKEGDLVVSAVLSGNRNFEGRVHPQVKANWLASPGTTRINLQQEPLGKDKNGQPVFLKDIWPSNAEIAAAVAQVTGEMFNQQYASVFIGDKDWQNIQTPTTTTYQWNENSTYVRQPPFFINLAPQPQPIKNIHSAHILALLGDSITTDHISPAGNIAANSPAGTYLQAQGVAARDFNSYGARRGNHEVMMRGTFANIRIRNEMLQNIEGGYTRYIPSGETLSIYDAAMRYQKDQVPLVIIAGKEYGTGSSRDWAAKGTCLLGIKAVIAESFERIHRSNLIGMGILPFEFKDSMTRKTLQLEGNEKVDILGLVTNLVPRGDIQAVITRQKGNQEKISLRCRIDTQNELEYYRHGGILQYVLRNLTTY
jgi:aconitate hydratase